jgi:NADPH:quinone reductase-like Zn-dependent oxidoreductase
VLDLLASGVLEPVATSELPLEDVNEAHARIVERRAGGKLLLVP